MYLEAYDMEARVRTLFAYVLQMLEYPINVGNMHFNVFELVIASGVIYFGAGMLSRYFSEDD